MICLIDCGSSWVNKIKQHLNELGHPLKVVKLDKVADHKFGLYSGIIISGGPILLTKINQPRYLKLFKFVKTVGLPILGICLGHQIIGLLYGSRIGAGRLVSKRERIRILKSDLLFSGVRNQSLFREEHYEFITLPKGFNLLAKSKSCGNEAMKFRQGKIYGVQFHPEMSGGAGKVILRNFLSLCSD